MPRGASEGRAAEAAWAREIAEKEGKLEQEEKEEESVIHATISALKKRYGSKTPNDLLIDPKTGTKLDAVKRRRILWETGESLSKVFANLSRRINSLLERDLHMERELSYLFSSRSRNMLKNIVTLQKIKKKQGIIKKALANAEAYWATVRDQSQNGELPSRPILRWVPLRENSEKITKPLEFIEDIELGLIAEMEKKLSKGEVRLIRPGYS